MKILQDYCINMVLWWSNVVASLFELQTQLEISSNLEYISKESFDRLYGESRERMLSSLIRKLKEKR
ncbi:four helix bundle protein [Tenacibaculum discolor]|uniref:four helix bundle protein n=2 Tax=Tenacibaculum TaxID=104267 RepID=UPI000EAE9865|nr:four helix bundle protein [Tenacibaculum discolor]NVK08925.1 four helix bundle protein [Tenacibaculum sp.]